jgi:hypothetical protein
VLSVVQDEMNRPCNTLGREYKVRIAKWKERDHLEYQGVDGRGLYYGQYVGGVAWNGWMIVNFKEVSVLKLQ